MLLPTLYAKLFGIEGGVRVYSIGFSFVGVGSLINQQLLSMFLDGTWGDVLGYQGFCYLYGTLSCVSLVILLFFFKEERAMPNIMSFESD